ncbi:hypothetical protein ACFWMS_23730 [Peribacillus butanolivorans]|uniref:hypothetical protein n=1 Tax=Peribacillus butanolivorans TaxID=421767 RepID=UPI003653D922
MRYKIDFGRIITLCIIVMVFDPIWSLLEDRPEAFAHGNIVYHVVGVFSFILTNLAIGIAGAIVFYFMSQFLEKNKNFESFADLRTNTIWLLCTHMKILSELKQFEELNKRERFGDLFYSPDVPILIKAFKNINSEEQKSQLKENLKKYFSNTSNQRLLFIMIDFKENINRLDSKKNIRYFKGSKDLIESLTSKFRDFSTWVSYYKDAKAKNEEDKQAVFLKYLVDEYYDILESTIELYEELEIFIDCIENKRLLTFIRMVD